MVPFKEVKYSLSNKEHHMSDMQELQVGQTVHCNHCGVTLQVTNACKCDGEECCLCEIKCCGKPMVVSKPSDEVDG